MRRDIFIETIGILVMVVTIIFSAQYLGHKQEMVARVDREYLEKLTDTISADVKDRQLRRSAFEARLDAIDARLQAQVTSLGDQKDLIIIIAEKLRAETANRKNSNGTVKQK